MFYLGRLFCSVCIVEDMVFMLERVLVLTTTVTSIYICVYISHNQLSMDFHSI